MTFDFDLTTGSDYTSNSQKIRAVTENWFENNMFCPRCGNDTINSFENNRPVADFYCKKCNNEYELKSKNGPFSNKIINGAYETMISRITSNTNPDLFCLNYSRELYKVNNLILIPKYFFTPDIIEKRKPLSQNARRAGWVGCNILVGKVPEQCKIHIIKDGILHKKEAIVETINKSNLLATKNIEARGWLLDILNCINKIKTSQFSLFDIYKFEINLSTKHPNNNHIKAKIRQQLQLLRNKGFIEFLGDGKYKKLT